MRKAIRILLPTLLAVAALWAAPAASATVTHEGCASSGTVCASFTINGETTKVNYMEVIVYLTENSASYSGHFTIKGPGDQLWYYGETNVYQSIHFSLPGNSCSEHTTSCIDFILPLAQTEPEGTYTVRVWENSSAIITVSDNVLGP